MSHRTPTIPNPNKLMLALAAIAHVANAQLYTSDDMDDEYYERAWDDELDGPMRVAKRCWYYGCHYNGSWHLTGPAIAGIVLFSFLILIFMIVIVRHCFIEAHDADLYYQHQNQQEAYLPQHRPAAPRYSYPLNGPAIYTPPTSSPSSAGASGARQEMREHTRERRRYAAMPVVPLTIPQREQANATRAVPPPWEPREPLPAYMTDANNPKVAPADEKASPDAASDYTHR